MSNEELVMSYQQGNIKALEQLIEQNQGIVYKLANRFWWVCENNKSIDIEDLIQEGNIGLMTSAGKYNFELECRAPFINYAVYHINARIYRYFNHNNKKEERSLNKSIEKDRIEEELMNLIPDNENYEDAAIEEVYQEQLKKDLYGSMYKVNTITEINVLELNFGLNNAAPISIREIGELLDIPYNIIENHKIRALRKLRHSPVCFKYKKLYLQENYSRRYKNTDTLINQLMSEKNPIYKKYLGLKYIPKIEDIPKW
ncbi:MAG: sigma-70 family RNA polymerase sigma factor [Clostridiaceae bacterium]